MKLKDFKPTSDNHFIAMQYYGLILNRTFLIILTNDLLIGIKANGLVSAEAGENIITIGLSSMMTVKGDLENPYAYVKLKFIDKIREYDLLDGSILIQNKTNFIIKRRDIMSAYYDPKKKWGMGQYPHDGKVYIETLDGKKKEFIIVGNQSGHKIANLILTNRY